MLSRSLLKQGISFARLQPVRPFSQSPHLRNGYHFDTLKFVKRLEAEGFTPAQSQSVMRALADVINER